MIAAPTIVRPVGLQLSRRKGFNLQALSAVTNQLWAVNVARPSKWGNPFYPGCGIGYGGFRDDGSMFRHDVAEPETQVRWFGYRMAELKTRPAEFEAYIAPLRGKNLGCWCALDAPCHRNVLLELSNLQIICEGT